MCVCVWRQNLQFLSEKPQFDSSLFPIQTPAQSHPCYSPTVMIGFLSWVAIYSSISPHLLEDYDTPGEEEAALPPITEDSTMHSYVSLVKTGFVNFLSIFWHLRQWSFSTIYFPYLEKDCVFNSFILLLVVMLFLKETDHIK